jgi:hypothetical protein
MQAFYQLPYERFERWSPFGSPERVAEVLAPYAEAGCSIFNLIAVSSSPEAAVDRAAELASLLREHLDS